MPLVTLEPSEKGILTQIFYLATTAGGEAVIVFFVLSGYLVCGSLIERVGAGTFSIAEYATDRVTRLCIPLLPALILTTAAYLTTQGAVDWPAIIGSAFFLQDIVAAVPATNKALWTLSYEFWFYAVAGLAGVAAMTRRPFWLLLAGLALLMFTALSPLYLLCWLVGAIAYLAKPGRFSLSALTVATGATLFALGLSLATTSNVSIDWAPSKETATLFLAVTVAMLIQQLALASTTGSTLGKVGSALAAFSYTLYLTHYPVLYFLSFNGPERATSLSIAGLGVFVTKLAVCVAVSWVIYQLSERHTNAVRRWIKSGASTIAARRGGSVGSTGETA
jgi:peptidoglycan/LPS O-acetylase OafA/YrhL